MPGEYCYYQRQIVSNNRHRYALLAITMGKVTYVLLYCYNIIKKYLYFLTESTYVMRAIKQGFYSSIPMWFCQEICERLEKLKHLGEWKCLHFQTFYYMNNCWGWDETVKSWKCGNLLVQSNKKKSVCYYLMFKVIWFCITCFLHCIHDAIHPQEVCIYLMYFYVCNCYSRGKII